MGIRRLARSVFVSILVCNTTLARIGAREVRPPSDAWYRPVPSGDYQMKWLEIAPSSVYRVARQNMPRAKLSLERSPIVQLRTSQIEGFVGRRVTPPMNTRPYLVRALYYDRGTGRYSVNYRGKSLWVHHQSLGPASVPMKRDALVVFINAEVAQIYVTCGRTV
jgi:hypothetical protein